MVRYFYSAVLFFVLSQSSFAATISSATSGNWSSSSTWNGGIVPGVNDDVSIPSGANIVLDANTTVRSISVDGTLKVDMTKDISITTAFIMVHGVFEWGTVANPYTNKGLITLTGSDKNASIMGMGTKFIGTMGGGTLSIHGQQRYGWTMLNQTAGVNATTIVVQDAVDWNVGEEIIITTTGREHDLDKKLAYTQTEKRTIVSIAADKKTITLNQPLAYSHFGELQTFSNGAKSWTLDERAEVGLLTRNIKIQGDAASENIQFGGHIMSMAGCKAYISGVELYRMGQAGINARYPFHWHMAGNVAGQYIKNSCIHHSYQRAITVHGVQNATVEDNVCYDIKGHGIFLEDGNETNTLIKDNLVSYVHKPDANNVIRPSDVFNLPSRIDGPAGIWVSHPTNDLVNNAVSSCGTGIWYALLDHPDGPSFDPNVRVNDKPLGNVDGNRTHSCYAGFMVDFADVDNRSRTEAVHYHCPAGQVVKNATSFHCMRTLWWRGSSATFENCMTANPYTHQGGNVFTFSGTFKNGLMVGHSANLTSSPDVMMYATGMYDGNEELIGCHFANFDKTNQAFTSMLGGASKNLPMTVENCTKANARVLHLSKTWEANPEENNVYSSILLDKTGQILGAPNKWAVLNHPFLTDNSFTKLDNGDDIGGMLTDKPFGRVRFIIHGITDQQKSTLYADWADGHQSHNRPLGPHWEMPVMVNSDRIYRFRMTDYTPNKMTVSFSEAHKIGDKIKFFIEGFPQEMNVASHVEWPFDTQTPLRRVFNSNDYNAATDNVYFWDGSKAWFQLIARYINQYSSENILITSPTGNQLGVAAVASRPYLGKRWNVNAIVQAEEFDHGGQAVGCFEKKGNDFLDKHEFKNFDQIEKRMGEMVDLTKASPQSNNFYISDIKTNEWWNYSYAIPAAGTYTLKLSLSSKETSNEFRVLVDGNEAGRKTFGAGDFNVQTMNLNLTQGDHVIRIEALTDDFLFDWLSIQSSTNSAPFITITAPTENQKIAGNFTFSTTPSNDGSTNGNGISNVVFNLKQNGLVKATFTDNDVPYNWAVNTINHSNGLYELEVIAINTANQTNIKIIPVQIENPYDCAGVLNGTAFMDGCGKCTGGNTGKPLCSDTLWDKGFELMKWTHSGFVSMTFTEETQELTATGPAPHMWGPDRLFIPAHEFRYFHVRMKNMGSKTEGKITWLKADGAQGAQFYPVTANDSEYKDYVIDLSINPDYFGIINRNIFQATSNADVGEKVSVERLEFSRIDRRDCNGVWRGTAYKDKCNTCVGGNTGKTSIVGCDTTKYTPPTTAFISVNSMPWDPSGVGTLCAGGTVWVRPQPDVPSWSWTGPNGFTSSNSDFLLSNIQTNQAGTYIGTYTDANGNSNTASYTITVIAASDAGTASAPASVCVGTYVEFKQAGGTGTFNGFQYQWDATSGTWTNWDGAYWASSNPGQTLYIRAQKTNGACPSAYSAPVSIKVDALSDAGTASAPATVCVGANVEFKQAGGTGTFNGFQVQWDATSGAWTNWDGANWTASNPGQTLYIRAQKTSGVCPSAYSAPVAIKVDAASDAGTASAPATVCVGTNVEFKQAGGTGTFNGFQFQWDATSGAWTNWDGAYWASSNPGQTLYIRAQKTNGACPGAYSAPVAIKVDALSDAGSASAPATVCVGSNVEFKQTGGTGTFNSFQVQWDATSGAWTNWDGANWTASSPGKTLYIRAQKTNGVCPSHYSPPVSIKVDALSNAGTASAPATVCVGSNVEFKQVGGAGTFNGFQVQWDVTSGAWTNWDGANWTASSPGKTLYIRAQKTNGVCSSAYSAPVSIKVDALSDAGTASAPDTVCVGANVEFKQVGGNGAFNGFQVQWDATSGAWTNWDGANWTASSPGKTLYIRAQKTNGVCSSAYSAPVSTKVDVCTSIEEKIIQDEIVNGSSVFPNPAQLILNVRMHSTAIGQTLYLMNAIGEVVVTQNVKSTNEALDIQNLSSGVYMLKVRNAIHKVIITK